MRKITYIQGKATFVDAKNLSIEPVGGGDEQSLTFEHAIIATGSYPDEDSRPVASTATA